MLEVTLGRLSVTARGAVLLSVTGAPVGITVSDEAERKLPTGAPSTPALVAAMDTPIPVADGQTVTLGRPASGLRSYLAVRGGIDVPSELGSRSTDLLSGIGPEPIVAGRVLAVGDEHMGVPHAIPGPEPAGDVSGPAASTGSTVPTVLTVLPGPRADWFEPGAFQLLLQAPWQVTPASNRVGLRLRGSVLGRVRHDELPSEGLVPGAIQVQPGGEPVLFLADHPVTGGYPVIAVVTTADVDAAAQLRPGGLVRFRAASGLARDLADLLGSA